nr:hypothetical protein [Carrot red leaf luteovirus associated RNA]
MVGTTGEGMPQAITQV